MIIQVKSTTNYPPTTLRREAHDIITIASKAIIFWYSFLQVAGDVDGYDEMCPIIWVLPSINGKRRDRIEKGEYFSRTMFLWPSFRLLN